MCSLDDVFDLIDRNGDNDLAFEEVREFVGTAFGYGALPSPPSEATLRGLFDEADADGSGGIGRAELESMLSRLEQQTGSAVGDVVACFKCENYKRLFRLVDEDGGGSISVGEARKLMEALPVKATDEQVRAAVAEADSDGSGEIEEAEFVALLERLTRGVPITRCIAAFEQVKDEARERTRQLRAKFGASAAAEEPPLPGSRRGSKHPAARAQPAPSVAQSDAACQTDPDLGPAPAGACGGTDCPAARRAAELEAALGQARGTLEELRQGAPAGGVCDGRGCEAARRAAELGAALEHSRRALDELRRELDALRSSPTHRGGSVALAAHPLSARVQMVPRRALSGTPQRERSPSPPRPQRSPPRRQAAAAAAAGSPVPYSPHPLSDQIWHMSRQEYLLKGSPMRSRSPSVSPHQPAGAPPSLAARSRSKSPMALPPPPIGAPLQRASAARASRGVAERGRGVWGSRPPSSSVIAAGGAFSAKATARRAAGAASPR